MLLATVDSLTDDELAAPSKCGGWTRAHVVAHLALGADAMGNMITWGTTGVETPPYVSWDARNADIENLAEKSPAEIKAALHTAVKDFADKAATLKDGLKAETVPSRPLAAPISPRTPCPPYESRRSSFTTPTSTPCGSSKKPTSTLWRTPWRSS